jgi:hypothetical protein
MPRKTLIVVIALLTASTPVGAHRLDEYLQATRIGIDLDRVNLEIDLTPGVSIASQVKGWIDTNGDGQLSRPEALGYARQVFNALELSVDRQRVSLTLADVEMPEPADMTVGTGTIRLRASAAIPSGASGRHQLTIVNSHRPELSVYLSNALVPSDTRIQILAQQRDRNQHTMTIEYDVETIGGRARISWLVGASGLLAGAALLRRKPGRFRLGRSRPVSFARPRQQY